MTVTRRLWLALGVLLTLSFTVLLWVGGEIHRQAPPMPERALDANGTTLYTREDIETGRQVWQSIGGQQLGSVWGHGAYVAPDWSAGWLHREASALLDVWARKEHAAANFGALDAGTQAVRDRLGAAQPVPGAPDAVQG